MKSTPSNSSPGISRRRFLTVAGAAAVFAPTIIPASALGRSGKVAPSNRIVMGAIGWGMMGPGNTRGLMAEKDCQMVAFCDIDGKHRQKGVDDINKHYGNTDCRPYHDFRDMLSRPDLDAVMIAIPDHWHALVATEAAIQKKDIYGEKPLARTIAEQQAIVKAVHKNKRIWQTGSWQRSQENFHRAAEIVRNGLIGKVKHVEVGLPGGHSDFLHTADKKSPTTPPPELDYDMWVGPSEKVPYIEAYVHMSWRWNYNFGGGQLLDWIGHHCDIAHWGLGMDQSGGPMEIEGTGEFPPKTDVWNTATSYRSEMKYTNDITMVISGGHDDVKGGTKWVGTDGWVWCDRGGAIEGSNPDFKKGPLPNELRKVKLYESSNHYRNFLDCIKSRKPTITPAETAHHSAIPGHLSLISMMLGRKIKWDPKHEKIIGDAEASKMLTRPYRDPWKLVV